MDTSALTPREKDLLVEAVGGPSAARSILRGSKVLKDRFCIYAEVVVGGAAYRPKRTTLNMLQDKGYLKDSEVTAVLESPAYSISRTRLDLKLATACADDLGLTDGGTYADIIAAAKKVDLVPCPEDTAAAIMLQMSVAWTSGSYVVATAPIVHHMVAYLFRVSERRLMLAPGDKGHHWGPFDRFLFRKL